MRKLRIQANMHIENMSQMECVSSRAPPLPTHTGVRTGCPRPGNVPHQNYTHHRIFSRKGLFRMLSLCAGSKGNSISHNNTSGTCNMAKGVRRRPRNSRSRSRDREVRRSHTLSRTGIQPPVSTRTVTQAQPGVSLFFSTRRSHIITNLKLLFTAVYFCGIKNNVL